jgi:hypothetical protein
MKITSVKQVPYEAGRGGVLSAIIEIEQVVMNRDAVNKLYTIQTTDYAMVEASGSVEPNMGAYRKYLTATSVTKSYKDFDAEIEKFRLADTSGVVGSELEDKALLDIFLKATIKAKPYLTAEWTSVVG